MNPSFFDVIVVGSGLAGTTAALSAARYGCRVALVSRGMLFSGSSFYPGTWGLGLIAPFNDMDAHDLEQQIISVGQSMADPQLVHTLVMGIRPAIERLEAQGVALVHPEHETEREFIACFDRKTRLWRGILRKSYEQNIYRELMNSRVSVLNSCELLDFTYANNSSALQELLLFDHKQKHSFSLFAPALVLAQGGYSGLFPYNLTSKDVLGSVHGLALSRGAELCNIEFFQIMPSIVSPVHGLIYNEKAFRFSECDDSQCSQRFSDQVNAADLLDIRSGYGPYTTRFDARLIDECMASSPGKLRVRCRLSEEDLASECAPEFVKTYYQWLASTYGLGPRDWLNLAPAVHASNGGLRITSKAQTNLSGVFACGECCGGMHGADRIGGLSSANALVFGEIAGREAALWARKQSAHTQNDNIFDEGKSTYPKLRPSRKKTYYQKLFAALQNTLEENCLIGRTQTGLMNAHRIINGIREELQTLPDSQNSPEGLRLTHQLTMAQALVCAMTLRKETRGCHSRNDFPKTDEAQAKPRIICKTDIEYEGP